MDDLTLSFTRTIAASPNAVWRCWTEPDLLRQWFAPAPVVVTLAELDPQPGGAFRTVMQVPDYGEMAGDPGCVLVAEPAVRLVWTNALGPGFQPNVLGTGEMDFAFTADIRMASTSEGCQYDVSVLHASRDGAAAHERMGFFTGWGAAADQLAVLAASLSS